MVKHQVNIDPQELAKTRYGLVVYLGRSIPFKTVGYDASAAPGLPEDPEGCTLYEFTETEFIKPIHTLMDQKYFEEVGERTGIYEVHIPDSRPGRSRRPRPQLDVASAVGKLADNVKAVEAIELEEDNSTDTPEPAEESKKPKPASKSKTPGVKRRLV